MSTCRSCGAKVIWTLTTSGKKMPVDAVPVADGNVILEFREGEQHSTVLPAGAAKPADVDYYKSHFATCPRAADHRKKS